MIDLIIVCLPAIFILGAVYALREVELKDDQDMWEREYKRILPPYYEDDK